MKKLAFVAAMLAVYAFAETNSIDWRYGKPGVRVVTNAPSVARFTGEIARVEGRIDGIALSAGDHAALSNLSWTASGHYGAPARLAGFFEGGMAGYAGFGWGLYLDGSDNIAVSNDIISGAALGATAIQPSVFIPLADRVSGLEGRSNDWNTAFGWGNWAGPVASNTAAIAVLQTNTLTLAAGVVITTNLQAQIVASTQTVVQAASTNGWEVGAHKAWLTNETDLAALRAYHYGSPDIVENPAEWFTFADGVITGFNWETGRTNVVIPWEIGGVPVTAIGARAFGMSDIVSVIAPQTVTAIGSAAFSSCYSLTSVSLPQAQTVGDYAFSDCTSLSSVSLPQVTLIGEGVFADCVSLASVSLPQVTLIGDYMFAGCSSLASVSLPQATSIGDHAFIGCPVLAVVSLPQVTSIGVEAFAYCGSLTSVHMGQNAPAEATGVFDGITQPPTVYVTNPQATGWGAVWNGAPVVRPPLYADSVTVAGTSVVTRISDAVADHVTDGVHTNVTLAGTVTIGGVTRTDWPSGATNITDGVTSGTYSEATRTLNISNLLEGVSMELPDGIVTNGQNGMTMQMNGSGDPFVRFSGTGGGWGSAVEIVGTLYLAAWGGRIRFADSASISGAGFYLPYGGGLIFWGPSGEAYSLYTEAGHVSVPNGNLTVSKTNTAAVVRSTGGYIIGPTISGKQAHIFTDGTNTFQVDVNDLTNQFATVADATGIIAPLISSGTNVTVTSTQSVYSVAVTGAGPVGIDWSGLALDGTGRAEITLRLNVTDWAGTNITFSPALTFDQTPEILVTGVWEFAASTIDGVTTRVRQTWPETGAWTHMMRT
ncbi:MAG: hypothetical protein BWY57_02024 [Betaproteobacteria bacterium ADurb.Bin341]|nr:MAG: hypothetical protein BWY57_02024 [Betaproteobacteria bacterium ADurb.Bin341]